MSMILTVAKVKKPLKLTLTQALYAPPNPNKERKNCKNCVMASKAVDRCNILPKDFKIQKAGVCGYHVYGSPEDSETVEEPLDPKLAGYEVVEGGTSCDVCVYYDGDNKSGVCEIVFDKGARAKVEARGCCALWDDG